MSCKKKLCGTAAIGTLAVLFLNTPISAQPDDADSLMDMSLDALLNLQITTASKTKEKVSDAPGVISVITRDEIERFGGTSLLDLLMRIPSLALTTTYMTDRAMLASRGDQIMGSSGHNLFLINGRPVREIMEGGIQSEMYKSFPIGVIDRIEVIRGPGSVLYGSQAFSAVINVITRKADKNSVSFSGFAQDRRTYGMMQDGTIKIGDLSVTAGGRYFTKADWNIQWEAIPMGMDTLFSNKVSIPDNGYGTYVELNYKGFSLMFSYDQWLNYNLIPDFVQLEPTMGTVEWEKTFGDVGYKFDVNKIWNMSFNVTITRSQLDVSKSWPYPTRDGYEYVGEWTNFITPLNNLSIIFGTSGILQKGYEEGDPPTGHQVFNDAEKGMGSVYTHRSIGNQKIG